MLIMPWVSTYTCSLPSLYYFFACTRYRLFCYWSIILGIDYPREQCNTPRVHWTDTHTHRPINTCRYTNIYTYTHTYIHTDRQTCKHTNIQTYKHTPWEGWVGCVSHILHHCFTVSVRTSICYHVLCMGLSRGFFVLWVFWHVVGGGMGAAILNLCQRSCQLVGSDPGVMTPRLGRILVTLPKNTRIRTFGGEFSRCPDRRSRASALRFLLVDCFSLRLFGFCLLRFGVL